MKTTSAEPWRLHLLGGAQLWRGALRVTIQRRKSLALLCFLALNRRRISRERLATLLWPERDGPRGLAYLRNALWELSRIIGPEAFESDSHAVELAPSLPLRVDALELRAAVSRVRAHADPAGALCAECQAALSLALEGYHGDLMAGLNLDEGEEFTTWQQLEAASLRSEASLAFGWLSDTLLSHGATAAALALAQRWIARDQFAEAAHRALIRALAASGQRSEALRHGEALVALLAAELAAEPEAATRNLLAELRQSGPAPRLPITAVVTNPPPLPAASTPFLGREDELALIAERFSTPTTRLLSLVGPGGIGKTRLALEAARRLGPQFRDGTAFAALAAIREPHEVAVAICQAIGLRPFGADAPRQLVIDALRSRAMLLVIDNFEQVISAADLVAEILANAPDVRLLITTRERLGLLGEHSLGLRGLAFGQGEAAPAHRLFALAAQRQRPDLALTSEDHAAIAKICRLLDGVPLALELAAAWLRVMRPSAIAAELAASFELLSNGPRDLPERHRSLRALFDHSWELLSAHEQRALAQLSLMRGSFDQAAARALLGPDALILLSALCDKSLLGNEANGRFVLHELLRQFAAERLNRDQASAEAAQTAHSRYYLHLLAARGSALRGMNQIAALAELRPEMENLRAAWETGLRQARYHELAATSDALFRLYEVENLFEEAAERFGRAADLLASVPDQQLLYGNLLVARGWFLMRRYQFREAYRHLDRALTILRPFADQRGALIGLLLASAPSLTGGRNGDEHEIERYLTALRISGDRWGAAFALRQLALSGRDQARSRRQIEESLTLSRALGDQRLTAENLATLAHMRFWSGEYHEGIAAQRQALHLYQGLSDRWAIALSADNLGFMLRLGGEFAAAEALHTESLALSRAVGDRLGIAGSLDNLALIAIDRGDLERAEQLAREGLELRAAVGHDGSTAVSFYSLAEIALARGALAEAQQALEEAQRLHLRSGEQWMHGRLELLYGRIALARGDLQAAERDFQRMIGASLGINSLVQLYDGLIGLAEVRAAQGDWRAAHLIITTLAPLIAPYARLMRRATPLIALA